MRIKLKTVFASPNGVYQVGQVVRAPGQITVKQAEDLLAGGYAEEVKGSQVETAAIEPPETATPPKPKPKKTTK